MTGRTWSWIKHIEKSNSKLVEIPHIPGNPALAGSCILFGLFLLPAPGYPLQTTFFSRVDDQFFIVGS